MNKRIFGLFSILLLVISVSGCVGGNDLSFAGFDFMGVNASQTASEVVTVSAESTFSEVPSGRKTELYFDVKNEGTEAVEDVSLEIVDSGSFESLNEREKKDIGELEPKQTSSWNLEYRAPSVKMEKQGNFLYQLDYKSDASARYKVHALSEDEYLRLKKRGSLKNSTKAEYYKKKGPVEIQLSFSQKQPYVGGDSFTVNVDVLNKGRGRVLDQKIDPGSFSLTYPGFLSLKGCQKDMSEDSRTLENSDSIYFVNKKAGPISCNFRVEEGKIDVQKSDVFKLGIRYKYLVYEELPVKVTPR